MRNDGTADDLQKHMIWTYYGLRYALIFIGFLLPPVVYAAGRWLHQTSLQTSISAYYYVPSGLDALATRDLFVGGLVTAAFCLYAYKGYNDVENNLLNAAAVCALGVAFIPSTSPDGTTTLLNKAHTASAIAFFGFLALVCWFCANETIHLVKPPRNPRFFRLAYAVTGSLMVLVVLLALLTVAFRDDLGDRPVVFFLEAFGMWVFGLYWLFKTYEMRGSDAERLALEAQLLRKKADGSAEAGAPGEMKVMRKTQ